MDAHAHLLSLGWAGPGHSLDSRPHLQHKGRRGLAYDPSRNDNTGRGLVKPLLVSQKKNSFGVGKKAHEPAAGNEWWLKGFETALNNIGKRYGSEATSGTATPETPSGSRSGYRGKHNGLYGFFVKGQQMEGTMRERASKQSGGKKRKSDTFDNDEERSVSSSTTTPGSFDSEETAPTGEATADFEQINQFPIVRDKDRRRGEITVKADPAQGFEQMGPLFEAASQRTKKHAKRNEASGQSNALSQADDAIDEAAKSDRRPRRKAAKIKTIPVASELSDNEQRRRERRAAKAAASASSSKKGNAWSSALGKTDVAKSQEDISTSADEALRRAERKKRKDQKRLAKMQTDC